MITFTTFETQLSTHHHRVPRGSEGSLGPEVRGVGLRTAATRTLGQVVIPWWEVGNWRKVGTGTRWWRHMAGPGRWGGTLHTWTAWRDREGRKVTGGRLDMSVSYRFLKFGNM